MALVAKKSDNTDGFELIYKSINDIQANEFHVATSIDGRQSQEFLEQTKKHLDKNAVKNQVDKLAKAKNVAKVFNTAQELVDDIVAKRNTIRKVLQSDAGKEYAKKYFEKVIKEGNFEDWYSNVFMKYDLGEPLNFEVHHIIPINILKENEKLQQLLLWAEQNGKKFDFNGLDNGIPLQKKRLKYGVNGHAKHPNYDEAIIPKIENITSSNVLKNEEKLEVIQDIVNKAKEKLEKDVLLGTKDVNEIINF
ncbi:AHH domain-containing protein [Capnocytophaga canimorsus]|nr:AHH domain-containing protein [Capnocytophaga canimorsus]WGU67914.1 AHH domain-containing protein [Capnocytophaga canimorsus]